MTKSKRRTETVDKDHLAAKREKLASNNETLERRVLRSKYLQVLSKINDEREDLSRFDSGKFSTIFDEVENLHQLVQKPREQIADAEAFLEVTNALVTSVQSQSNEGVTAADFVNGLISEFGINNGRLDSQLSMDWRKIGLAVSPALSICRGLCTMVGPMNTEVKTRKVAVRRKRERPTQTVRPEELDADKEEKTDTDKNMKTMFEILRKKKRVKLESLILNRKSFAQTTENLFALSFLVKDGRVEISVNENGSHFVVPRNAPASEAVMSGKVVYNHFVFRFDFKDWKSMIEAVPVDEELMPHRSPSNTYGGCFEVEPNMNNSQATLNTTPIRKLSRNRGLVIQEESVVEESPETGGGNKRGFLRSKRKIN